jgi:hypothetical protein
MRQRHMPSLYTCLRCGKLGCEADSQFSWFRRQSNAPVVLSKSAAPFTTLFPKNDRCKQPCAPPINARTRTGHTRKQRVLLLPAFLCVLFIPLDRHLKKQRADYGQQIIRTLAAELCLDYGRSFERSGLFRIVQFAEVLPDESIVATLSRQLGWSHFRDPAALNRGALATARHSLVESSGLGLLNDRWV